MPDEPRQRFTVPTYLIPPVAATVVKRGPVYSQSAINGGLFSCNGWEVTWKDTLSVCLYFTF